jgi:hypothetical protein
MKRFTTEEQLLDIKQFIQHELTKRGFHAKISEFKENRSIHKDYNLFILETEHFQTTPVIFKQLSIGNFGGKIEVTKVDGYDKDQIVFRIPIQAYYDHFDLGRNNCRLFTVTGIIDKKTLGVYELKAY